MVPKCGIQGGHFGAHLQFERRVTVRLVVKLFANLVSFDALKQNVRTAVRQLLNSGQASDTSDGEHRRIPMVVTLPSFFQQDHPDTVSVRRRIRHHFAITGLEYVQRQVGFGKEDDIAQWEKGNAFRDSKCRMLLRPFMAVLIGLGLDEHGSR